jgi:hypothetical protein
MRKLINSLLAFVTFVAIFFSAIVLAAQLNVYEKPEEQAKVISTIKSGDQVMPIFYTEKRDWVKIANPKNGEVGWVKVKELQGPLIITNVSGNVMQQQIVTDNAKNPQVYSIIQYSGPKELKPEEAQEMAKKMQQQQRDMEVSMQQMQKHMQQMIHDMNKNFDRNFYTFPVIQPIIVVPEQPGMSGASELSKSTKAKKQDNK